MGRVYTFYTHEERLRVSELLGTANISFTIHCFEDNSPYDGAFRAAIGMGEVIVHEEDEGKAKKLIRESQRE